MSHVSCIMSHISCPMPHVSCLMSPARCLPNFRNSFVAAYHPFCCRLRFPVEINVVSKMNLFFHMAPMVLCMLFQIWGVPNEDPKFPHTGVPFWVTALASTWTVLPFLSHPLLIRAQNSLCSALERSEQEARGDSIQALLVLLPLFLSLLFLPYPLDCTLLSWCKDLLLLSIAASRFRVFCSSRKLRVVSCYIFLIPLLLISFFLISAIMHLTQSSNSRGNGIHIGSVSGGKEAAASFSSSSSSSSRNRISKANSSMAGILRVPVPEPAATAAAAAALPKLQILLDLDETLIHTLKRGTSSAEFARATALGLEYFMIHLPNQSGQVCRRVVFVRPGARQFLDAASRLGEVALFTAGGIDYANAVLEKLDTRRRISRVFARDYVKFMAGGSYMKDLRAVCSNLKRCVLVDNQITNFLPQPQSGILCKSFVAEEEDNELMGSILPLLRACKAEEDVRGYLAPKLHMDKQLQEFLLGLRYRV